MDSSKIKDLSSKIKTVIGELLKNADSTCKRVLTLFDPSKDSDVNIGKLASLKRAELETLCKYLNIALSHDVDHMKKMFSSRKKLAKRIVMEITALYPTVCPECNEEYRVMHGHQPRARCWICLQGSHNCEELTARIEMYENLPTVLSGMVWLCGDCLTLNNPFPLSDDMGHKSGVNTPKVDKSLDSRNTTHDSSLPKEDDSTKQEVENSLTIGNLTEKLDGVFEEQQKAESKPNTCKHVCPRLMEGSCPHGVSGKTAAEGKEKCPLFHPKRCRKFMAFYTHETKGCTEGENCNSLHVNLCKSSIDLKKCLDTSCKAMHLVGTKRPKSMRKKKEGKDSASRTQTENQQSTSSKGNQTKSEKNPAKDKQKKVKKEALPKPKPTADSVSPESSFLVMTSRLEEMKSALVEEVKVTVQRELKAVKDEMGYYKQQLDVLKMAINPQLSTFNPAMAYYGPYKPTPCEMPPCNQMWMLRDRMQSQTQPQNTTPIPPAFC